MKIKKSLYSLQHRYPWETDWTPVKDDSTIYGMEFHETLLSEPSHLIEIEYRIIKKETVKLKNSEKKIIRPVPLLVGKELSEHVKKFQRIKHVQ
jgi:hypothetical protein